MVTVAMAKRNHTQGPAGGGKQRRSPAADYDSPWKEILDRYFGDHSVPDTPHGY